MQREAEETGKKNDRLFTFSCFVTTLSAHLHQYYTGVVTYPPLAPTDSLMRIDCKAPEIWIHFIPQRNMAAGLSCWHTLQFSTSWKCSFCLLSGLEVINGEHAVLYVGHAGSLNAIQAAHMNTCELWSAALRPWHELMPNCVIFAQPLILASAFTNDITSHHNCLTWFELCGFFSLYAFYW